jgi:hypothetical protein
VLIFYALYASRDEQVGGFSALALAGLIALVGPILYRFTTWSRSRRALAPTAAD